MALWLGAVSTPAVGRTPKGDDLKKELIRKVPSRHQQDCDNNQNLLSSVPGISSIIIYKEVARLQHIIH